jgi:hypothetical protein
MLLAKVFSTDDPDMRHALVSVRYPEHVAAAERMAHQEALRQLLLAYLPPAVYARPVVLAKHLRLPEAELREALERLQQEDLVGVATLPGDAEQWYVWKEA